MVTWHIDVKSLETLKKIVMKKIVSSQLNSFLQVFKISLWSPVPMADLVFGGEIC